MCVLATRFTMCAKYYDVRAFTFGIVLGIIRASWKLVQNFSKFHYHCNFAQNGFKDYEKSQGAKSQNAKSQDAKCT